MTATHESCSSAVLLEQVRKVYGSEAGSTIALDDLSLSVDYGGITGLLGPNGAGKTTCMEIIVGLSEPSSGKVLTCGLSP